MLKIDDETLARSFRGSNSSPATRTIAAKAKRIHSGWVSSTWFSCRAKDLHIPCHPIRFFMVARWEKTGAGLIKQSFYLSDERSGIVISHIGLLGRVLSGDVLGPVFSINGGDCVAI